MLPVISSRHLSVDLIDTIWSDQDEHDEIIGGLSRQIRLCSQTSIAAIIDTSGGSRMGSLRNLRALVLSNGANISKFRHNVGSTSRLLNRVKIAGDRPTQMPELIPGYGNIRYFNR